MRIGLAVREVRDAEVELASELGKVGERHHADHDVFHVTRTLIGVHQANLEALAPFGERYGVDVDPGDADAGEGPLARLREKAADVTGRRPEGGLLLLRDLRHLHLLYAEASVNWVLLGQGAQVARDQELLDTISRCHAQTLRGMKWTLTQLKTASPQVLAG
jgi:hypothetical protein